jgi:hypothetical protein
MNFVRHHHQTHTMLPTPRFVVTASNEQVQGRISYDGRSQTSSVWRGGAAYVQMCLTCGLEPGRAGFVSKCMCMCGLGKHGGMSTKSCGAPLQGNGDEHGICSFCGPGRPEILSIGTIEVKAKRPRSSYVPHVLRPGPTPIALAHAAVVAAAAAPAAAAAAAAAASAAAAAADLEFDLGRCFR